MSNPYGELIDDKTVRFERLLPGPIERVWQYLVDGDKRAKWLCGGDTELKEGGHVEMRFHNASLSDEPDIERPEKYRDMPEIVLFSGKVVRCEPPRLLEHTWEFGDDYSQVRYELEDTGDGVRLVLTHSRLQSKDEMLSVCGGWHTHLDILVDILNDRPAPAFWKTHEKNAAEYQRRVGA